MSTSALFTMLFAYGAVTGFTVYFFVKLLRTPPKPEPNSFDEE